MINTSLGAARYLAELSLTFKSTPRLIIRGRYIASYCLLAFKASSPFKHPFSDAKSLSSLASPFADSPLLLKAEFQHTLEGPLGNPSMSSDASCCLLSVTKTKQPSNQAHQYPSPTCPPNRCTGRKSIELTPAPRLAVNSSFQGRRILFSRFHGTSSVYRDRKINFSQRRKMS
jgi:hypothetical protein